MKRSARIGATSGLAAVALVVSAGLSGLIGLAPSSAAAANGDFVETFEDPSSMDRFQFQIHHSPNVNYTPSTWQGDHDANCGKPGTSRTINLPNEGSDPGDAAYWCAPGGPGSGHMMTSFRSTGYAQVDFSPKQQFGHVGQVCWDQNQTDLGNRKWTQMVVVPERTFQQNGERLDYVKPDIQGVNRPGAKGVYLTDGVFLFSMVTGSTAVYTGQSITDVDFRGFKNSDKAKRYTTCITDLENGRVQIELERDNTTEVRTMKGALPDGPARVIFQDDTYNSTKAPSPVPNPFTWHWDNISISSVARAKSGPVPPSGRLCFDVAGSPGDVALVNLTPVLAAGVGSGQLISSDVATPPKASNVNFGPGSVDPNVGAAPIGSDGKVCFANSDQASVHLVADHLGSISGSAYEAATSSGAPDRKVDTRVGLGGGAVRPSGRLCFDVAGSPGDVALVNLTPVLAAGVGSGQLISSDVATPPKASNVNFGPGSVDPNVGAAPIGSDGKVCFANSDQASVHLVADHLGSISGSAYEAATSSGAPDRKVDTRVGLGGGAVRPSGRLCFDVAGSPGDVALVNLTPVLAAGVGSGQLISSDVATPPKASNVNFGPGSVDPNVGAAPIGSDGKVCFANSDQASVHLVADHLGSISGSAYEAATSSGAPDRKVDTRVS